MPLWRRLVLASICVPIVCGVLGCGSGTANVSGTVKINGKPASLDNLQVSFTGDDGRPVCAVVDQDGVYRAVGVQRGENRVILAYFPSEASELMEEKARRLKPGDPSKALTPEEARQKAKDLEELARTGGALTGPKGFKNPIPDRYRDPRESSLTLTVAAGKDTVFDIDVTP
jgi:hypothetical protein